MENNLYQKKKNYLYSFRPLERQINVLEKQIALLRREMQSVKAISYSSRIPSKTKPDLSNAFVREEELIEQLISVKQRKIHKCAEICCQIELLKDEKEKSVLQLHYLQGESFGKISCDLNLSERQIFNINKSAIKHFELPTSGKGDDEYG